MRTSVAADVRMSLDHKLVFALSTLGFSALAGCATEVDPAEEEPVVAPESEATHVEPQQIALTGPCTTTTSCDVNYCCTTEECRFTTTITCRPRLMATAATFTAVEP